MGPGLRAPSIFSDYGNALVISLAPIRIQQNGHGTIDAFYVYTPELAKIRRGRTRYFLLSCALLR